MTYEARNKARRRIDSVTVPGKVQHYERLQAEVQLAILEMLISMDAHLEELASAAKPKNS